MFGEGFCHFFISALNFWIEHYTYFLNLTKFVSQHLIATHGHFHRHQFLTACFELFGGDHGHLAVATLQQRRWGSISAHTRRAVSPGNIANNTPPVSSPGLSCTVEVCVKNWIYRTVADPTLTISTAHWTICGNSLGGPYGYRLFTEIGSRPIVFITKKVNVLRPLAV
jgi:hypothetical protein